MPVERAKQKWKEASYFLDRLSETRGKEPEFGYMLSAFLSAVRSIGWVIQTDLRGTHGDRFNQWWDAAKASLPTPRVPFKVLVELRNASEKRGELFHRIRVAVLVHHPMLEEVEYTFQLVPPLSDPIGVRYQFRGDAGPSVSVVDQGKAPELEAVVAAVGEALQQIDTAQPAFDIRSVRYHLDGSSDAVSFDEMIVAFREHVDAMIHLIAKAETDFSAPVA